MPEILPDEMQSAAKQPMVFSEALDIAIGEITNSIREMESIAMCMTPEIDKRYNDLTATRDCLLRLQTMIKDIWEKLGL